MRFAFLLPLSVVLGTVALIAIEGRPDPRSATGPSSQGVRASVVPAPPGRLSGISAYTDPELDFDVAIPAGWQPIAVVDDSSDGDADARGSGHVVGFEAPREGPHDPFADYVMIEILPGRDSGLFATDGSRASAVEIDGVAGVRDRLTIDGHEVGGARLDLVVHQAEIRGLGWTIGFYSIGEVHRAALVADAFELLIRTFRLSGPPFRIARTGPEPEAG